MDIQIAQTDTDIRVTVVCVTYNQKEYIAKCLEGIVCQQTNFKYIAYIGDDCSNDGTTDIVREYAAKYPDKIVPFIREENMGSIRNFGDLLDRLESDYVAFCDGDDYWINDLKLQKQFDFLENNLDYNGCFGKARVLFEESDFLNVIKNHYVKEKDGNYYFPTCHRTFFKTTTNHLPASIMGELYINFSATMLRVNKEIIKLPDWYYESYIGDVSYLFLTVGKGTIKYISEIYSVYRKGNIGLTSRYKDLDEAHLNTRLGLITLWVNLRNYFIEYLDGCYKVTMENKIKLEMANYLKVILKYGEYDRLHEIIERYPDAVNISFGAYLSFYNDSRNMTWRYTWEGNKAVARDKFFMRAITPIVKIYLDLKKFKNRMKNAKNAVKKLLSRTFGFWGYWFYSLVPKKKKLWAFSSFRSNKYMDNSKYFYEYVLENHPEIKPVWLTRNKIVYRDLKSKNMPVKMANSISGARILSRAAIAVTDHFKVTDFSKTFGLNVRTKIVQLWHGVGIKSMGDGKDVKNTTIPGVVYSSDILPQDGDKLFRRVIKRIKYFFKSPWRELFEKYFLFVCPGQERIDMIGKIWNMPESAYFMAGHPRNIYLYAPKEKPEENEQEKKSGYNILYAPTYRWNPAKEKEMVNMCLEASEIIQAKMEEIDGMFTIRLHPHTWRNYKGIIQSKIRNYDRIECDFTADIYETMAEYSMVISDYSSISWDFAMVNKPVVYLCYDYETFIQDDAGFNLNYMEMTPGPKTYNWEDTLKEIDEYFRNPEKDGQMRKDICKYFFDPEVNGENNSERITEEIKRRLRIK